MSKLVKILFIVTIILPLHGFAENELLTVTEIDLRGVLKRLKEVNQIGRYEQDIVVDAIQSRGFAAITWDGDKGTIYVNPSAMSRESLNNWAFVLAHEIAHQILNHTGRGGSEEEFAADVYGGQLAVKAGYDPKPYIFSMFARPNSCSRSHGCWHTRAENLENGLGVKVDRMQAASSGYMAYEDCDCKSEEEHKKHLAAKGPFVPVVTVFSNDPLKSYEMVYSTGCIIRSGQ